MREAPEQIHARQRDVAADAYEADVSAGAGSADRLHHRLLRPDRLGDGVRAEPVRELLDPGDALVAAFVDEVVAPFSRASR